MPMPKCEPETRRRRQGHSPDKHFCAQLTRLLRRHEKILAQVGGKVWRKGLYRITFVLLRHFNSLELSSRRINCLFGTLAGQSQAINARLILHEPFGENSASSAQRPCPIVAKRAGVHGESWRI